MNGANSPVLILGATGGIGTQLAERLVEAGRPVVVAGRDPDKVDTLAERLDSRGIVCDGTDFDEVDRLFKEAGEVSGAVNCVGSMLLKAAHQTTRDELDETLRLNLVSAFALVRSAAQAMRKTGGSIVLMSSCAVRVGLPNHEAIAAAKGAVEGLTRSAAATYASRGIRVNAVAPGLTRTPLSQPIRHNELALKASIAMHPLGRIGEPNDVASAAAWLLGPESDWVTGQILGVDGGLSAARPRMRAT